MSGDGQTKKRPADSPDVKARVAETRELPRICAHKICRQLGARTESVEDFESMGNEGLLEAARTYSPEHGIPFRSWAYLKIRGAIFDGLRKETTLPRRVYQRLRALEAANQVREACIEDESAASLETAESADQRIASAASSMAMAMAASFLAAKGGVPETLADPRAESPEMTVMEKELLDKIRASIDRRPEAERKLLVRVYFGGATLDEAAKEQGLSKSWGSRLHARALEAVAREIRAATRERAEI